MSFVIVLWWIIQSGIFDVLYSKVQLLKSLQLYFKRGEWIVPNFEEIWPSGKPRGRGRKGPPTKGIGYIEHAMVTGIPGERDKDFTTVGKPKVITKILLSITKGNLFNNLQSKIQDPI